MQVVKTDAGYISGTVVGEPDKPVYVYRGIPYAAPPVGDLRWKPPQPVTPWKGIRECTAYSKIAPQTRTVPTSVTGGIAFILTSSLRPRELPINYLSWFGCTQVA